MRRICRLLLCALLAVPALAHRVVARQGGAADIVREILDRVAVPA